MLQNVGWSEWVPSQKQLSVGGVRIGMGCMNLVTAISRYTRVPVTLISFTHWDRTHVRVAELERVHSGVSMY